MATPMGLMPASRLKRQRSPGRDRWLQYSHWTSAPLPDNPWPSGFWVVWALLALALVFVIVVVVLALTGVLPGTGCHVELITESAGRRCLS